MAMPARPQLMALVALLAAWAAAAQSPVAKVVQLLTDLEAKVSKEGEEARKTFEEYSEWCEDRSKNLKYEVKTAKAEVEDLKATIEKATGSIQSLNAAIEDGAAGMATDEADLKAATTIRAKEEEDFSASEAELVDVISALERAVGIIEREMRKGSASMLQLKKATGVVQALQAMVEASMLASQDAAKLTALVQAAQQDEDGSDAFGAPDPTVYASHSGSIVDTLENLLDKAKEQLDGARKKETSSRHNFEMLKQSLVDEIKFGGQDLAKAKRDLAAQSEAKATAGGDLATTSKGLSGDERTLSTLHQDCMLKSQDYEAASKSRAEELKALADAKKVISDMTTGAESITYSLRQTSFLQLGQSGQSNLRTSVDLANFEAVRFVRNLAREQHSEALTQLARRMASAMETGQSTGQDPFAKVKGLIGNMIESLEKEAHADASHKAYCDKEVGETLAKKAEREAEVGRLTARIDSMSAASAELKEQVSTLQKQLADLSKSQGELMKMRMEEKADFRKNKPEMESGLEGVKMALQLLREYYAKEGEKAHDAAEGAGTGVIGLLEVVESDFTKMLAELSTAEVAAQAEYDQETKANEIERATKEQDVKYKTKEYKQETKANEIERATKEQDVKYKTKEYKQLDASVAEASSDKDGVQAELGAILDYKTHLQQMCSSKASTYGERKKRREAEVAGLREALSILEGEAVLLQRRAAARRLHGLRGAAGLRSIHRHA